MKTYSMMATTVLALGAAILSMACGRDATPAASPTSRVVTTSYNTSTASPGKPNSTIYLSDGLRQKCQISTIESVKEAPKFAFDQSAIEPEDRDVLAQVAQCLITGPLKGSQVQLVGRADPRGTQEYNMALGERRSSAVMQYLAGLGVASGQLSETSRGALDATGADDATWQKDRRVDIDLATTNQQGGAPLP